MKYLLLLLPAFLFADFEDWSPQEQTMWYSYVALNVVDTFQTFDLIEKQKDPFYKSHIEGNPLLGERPSKEEVVLLKLGINYLAYKVLDNYPDTRTATLGAMNGIYIATVSGNYEAGFRMNFKF